MHGVSALGPDPGPCARACLRPDAVGGSPGGFGAFLPRRRLRSQTARGSCGGSSSCAAGERQVTQPTLPPQTPSNPALSLNDCKRENLADSLDFEQAVPGGPAPETPPTAPLRPCQQSVVQQVPGLGDERGYRPWHVTPGEAGEGVLGPGGRLVGVMWGDVGWCGEKEMCEQTGGASPEAGRRLAPSSPPRGPPWGWPTSTATPGWLAACMVLPPGPDCPLRLPETQRWCAGCEGEAWTSPAAVLSAVGLGGFLPGAWHHHSTPGTARANARRYLSQRAARHVPGCASAAPPHPPLPPPLITLLPEASASAPPLICLAHGLPPHAGQLPAGCPVLASGFGVATRRSTRSLLTNCVAALGVLPCIPPGTDGVNTWW